MSQRKTYVWDVPTRLFHWLLVGLIGFSWYSAKTYHMDWHRWSGITVAGLIVFRILWGFIGATTARFSEFLKGPHAIRLYLQPAPGSSLNRPSGHNPLGGWSVIALLGVLAIQVGAGLFAVDIDGIESGPLSRFVSFDQGRLASRVHGISFNILLGLIGLHLVAIAFYLLVKRNNLIRPMITGWSREDFSAGARTVSSWRLLLAVGLAGALAWWLSRGLTL